MRKLVFAIIAAAAAALTTAAAQTPGQTPGQSPGQAPGQLPTVDLSENMVRAFIASIPDLKALGDRYDAMAPQPGDPVSAFQGLAVSAAARADLDRTVGAHGFGDYKTWTIVAQNIFSTYTYVKMGDVRQRMSAALAAIENNPSLTEQQKQMMRTQMGGMNSAMAGTPTPSEHNIALIGKMASEIETSLQAMNR